MHQRQVSHQGRVWRAVKTHNEYIFMSQLQVLSNFSCYHGHHFPHHTLGRQVLFLQLTKKPCEYHPPPTSMAEFTSPFEVSHFLNLSSVVYKAQPSWSHTGKSIGIKQGLRDALEVGQSMSLVFWVGKMERRWEVELTKICQQVSMC